MTKYLTRRAWRRRYLSHSLRGIQSITERKAWQGSWWYEWVAWTPHISADQEAEREGRKWDQTVNLKSNPPLHHSCFLPLALTFKRFHSLPEQCYHLGTKCSDTRTSWGHFTSIPQKLPMLKDHVRQNSCPIQVPVWTQSLLLHRLLSSYLKETKTSPGLPLDDGPWAPGPCATWGANPTFLYPDCGQQILGWAFSCLDSRLHANAPREVSSFKMSGRWRVKHNLL